MSNQRRKPDLTAWGVGTLLLIFYIMELMPSAGWLDSSEFIATAHALSVPHPPGHPLYVILAKAMSLLPLGDVAFRINLLSALLAALAAVAFLLCARSVIAAAAPKAQSEALAAGLAVAFGLGRAMVNQAVRAEVYSLNLLICLALLALALRQLRSEDDQGTKARLRLAMFLLGLGLANHHYLVVATTPALLLALILSWRHIGLRASLAALPFLALGLLPYMLLPLRAQAGALERIGWGDPSTLAGLLDIVSARTFSVASAPLGLAYLHDYLALVFTFLTREFTPLLFLPLLALALAGMMLLWRSSGRTLAVLALFGATSFFTQLPWGFDIYNPDIEGYFLPGLAALLLLAAAALARVMAKGTAWARGSLAGLAVSALLLAWDGHEPGRWRDHTPYDCAFRALQDAPPGAALLLSDFNTLFLGWHLQEVEGLRPDVSLVFRGFLGKPWYPRTMAEGEVVAHYPDRLVELAARRPLALELGVRLEELPFELSYHLQPQGALFRILPGPAPQETMTQVARAWARDRTFTGPLSIESRHRMLWIHYQHARHYGRVGQINLARWHLRQAWVLFPQDNDLLRLADELYPQGSVFNSEAKP